MAGLLANLDQAVRDWLAEVPGKTEEDARRLAAIQATGVLAGPA